ncbi:cell surface glycoprotein 1 [Ceratobasidium sp. AG-Ba]|nr:cell surface glycoprotein 1 [Ceratobasidium sp. AG-Ba]
MPKYRPPNKPKKNPDPDPVIIPSGRALQLPDEIDVGMKRWWGTEKRLREAWKHVAPRGTTTKNAITWVKDVFVSEFFPDYFKDLSFSENDALWYHQHIGTKIYGFVYRAAKTLEERGTLPTFRVSNGPRIKKRTSGHDYWRRSDLARYDELVAEWVKTHPTPTNFGEWMALSRKLFDKQPNEIQEKFKEIAAADLAAIQAHEMVTVSDARNKYLKKFVQEIKALIHQGEMKCGIQACVQLVMPLNGNQYKLKSLVSPPLSEFAKTGPIEDVLTQLQEQIERTGTNHVIEGPPRVRIICNFLKAMYPFYPPVPRSASVETRRGLWRNFVCIAWVFHGGSDKVPWGIISLDVESWIPAECMPEDAVWCDPGSMNRKSLLDWERVVQRCQDENRPFWFRRTITGPTPIDPSLSEESRREEVERNGKTECHLIFERPVTRSHATGDLPYTAKNYSYTAYYTASQVQSAPKPDHWNDLPTIGPDTSKPIFHPDEQKTIRDLALKCPNDVGERVGKALDCLEEHEKHIPSSTSNGLWAFSGQLPPIFPRDPITQLMSNSFDPIHPPLSYLTTSSAPHEDTFPHFIGFIETAIFGDLLCHRASKTLLGGPTGVVNVVRSLLIILFCVLAIRGDLELPGVVPLGYDKSTLPFKIYERVLEWIGTITDLLETSTEILRKTSQERSSQRYAALMSAPLFVVDESTEPTPDDAGPSRATPVAGRAASLSLPTKKARRSRTSRSSKGKRKRDQDEESEAQESMAGSDDDIDPKQFEGDSDGSTNAGTTYGDGNAPDMGEYATDVGSDGDSPMKSPRAASPESEDESEPLLNAQWEELSTQEYPLAFGEMGPLPRFYPTPYVSAAQVTAALQEMTQSATERLEEFRALGDSHEVVSLSDQSAAVVFAAAHPPILRPLRQLYYLRRVIWKQTATLATMTMSYCQLFLADLRSLMTTCGHGERIVRKEGLDVSRTADTLLAQIHKAKQISAQLQFAFYEFNAYHRLATQWFHAVDPAWCTNPPLSEDDDMCAFAKLHIAWVDKAEELTQHIRTRRLEILDGLRIPHEDSVRDEPIVWFKFGCPSRVEEPTGLRDCLKGVAGKSLKPASTERLMATTDIPKDKQKPGIPMLSQANGTGQPESTDQSTPSPSDVPSPASPLAPTVVSAPRSPVIPAAPLAIPLPTPSMPPTPQAHASREPSTRPPSRTSSQPQALLAPSAPNVSDSNAMDVDADQDAPAAEGKEKPNRNKPASMKPQPRQVSGRHRPPDATATSASKTRAQAAANKTAPRGRPNARGKVKR